MTMTPPPLPVVYDRDAEHLKILSICWYVYAALKALMACFMLLYIFIGLLFAVIGVGMGAAGSRATHDPSGAIAALPFAGMGLLFACIGGFFLVLLAVMAFLDFRCARSLAKQQRLTICYVASAIACIGVPVGTVLGVFTFIVLSRPSVQVRFQQAR